MPWDNTRGLALGPWWFRLTIGPWGNGWTLFINRRRFASKPINYGKTAMINGVRRWGYPKIAALDLRQSR